MVGRRGLSDGRATVLGGVPGDRRTGVPGSKVGYMPQVRRRWREISQDLVISILSFVKFVFAFANELLSS